MGKPTLRDVAVVGTGVIGRSWITVFARAGCRVRVYDRDPGQLTAALAWFDEEVRAAREADRISKKDAKNVRARVSAAGTLQEALEGVAYVQESGPEQLETKQALYAELDRLAAPAVILGSSTSALDMTDIARGLPGARRCVVAHPVNPPHVIPAVEVLGGLATDPAVVNDTCTFLTSVGQTPVRMKRYVPGFILNRMQAALIREAVDLVATGVADVAAVDATIRDGLGLRWALMGPFAVANTNADGGLGDYFTRYRGAYHGIWEALRSDVRLDDELVAELHRQTEAMVGPDRAAQRAWRDQLIPALRKLKASTSANGAAPAARKKRKGNSRKGKDKAGKGRTEKRDARAKGRTE